ncbi:hypothetical protein BT63DRAFT_453679 [Microthyrium microscopicum]|uniref:Uncharacterized protein n=1 Tax=Microthyrium microscopicum TaxID=703497 RepID=A0A6A6UJN6_9PEZI|nr:hypothetical protein BT63DRAFT_453679 [Microthyrium microscopicum]
MADANFELPIDFIVVPRSLHQCLTGVHQLTPTPSQPSKASATTQEITTFRQSTIFPSGNVSQCHILKLPNELLIEVVNLACFEQYSCGFNGPRLSTVRGLVSSCHRLREISRPLLFYHLDLVYQALNTGSVSLEIKRRRNRELFPADAWGFCQSVRLRVQRLSLSQYSQSYLTNISTKLGAHIGSVKHLEIHTDWPLETPGVSDLIAAVLSSMPHVRHLHWTKDSDIESLCPDNLFQLLAIPTQLKYAHFGAGTIFNWDVLESTTSALSSTLEILKVDEAGFLEQMGVVARQIRNITYWRAFVSTKRPLSAMVPHLQELHISSDFLWDIFDAAESGKPYLLGPMINTMIVEFFRLNKFYAAVKKWSQADGLIKKLSLLNHHPALRHIKFHITPCSDPERAMLDSYDSPKEILGLEYPWDVIDEVKAHFEEIGRFKITSEVTLARRDFEMMRERAADFSQESRYYSDSSAG